MFSVLNFFLNLMYTLSDTGLLLLDFLNTGLDIPGVSEVLTVGDVMFGFGLPLFFGYSVIKYLIPV